MNVFMQNAVLQRYYFSKSETERTLLLSCLFSVLLSAVRIGYTGYWTFISLNWNLFLAFIPYGLSKKLVRRVQWIEITPVFLFLFLVWLLFIPNAFYIITDLFHLGSNSAVPLWFDLALILSFAWNGLLFGILSVRQMEKIVAVKWCIRYEALFLYPVMFLNALGIYVGRYLRYNSWDVVTNPFRLAEDIWYLLRHPLRNRFDWSMIFCYAILMTLIYTAIKRISKAL
jgi:uncharacterized membrane protein